MSTTATLVVTASPNPADPEATNAYLQGVLPLLLGGGGQVVKRVGVGRAVAGSPDFRMLLVMDFPGVESIESIFASEAYRALVPVRERGFARMDIAIARDL